MKSLKPMSWMLLACCIFNASNAEDHHADDLMMPNSQTAASRFILPQLILRRQLSDDEADDDEDVDDDDEEELEEDDDDEEEDEQENNFDDFEDTTWLIHGSLMALSWGLLAPLAIGSSLLRRIIGDTWFKIHFYTQILVLVCSCIGIGLAIINVELDDDEHFDETHKLVGLTIFILLIIQVCSGLFRPHAPAHHVVDDEKVDEDSRELGTDDIDDSPPPLGQPKKTAARCFFEIQHRILGVGLVLLAWFNCSTGINELFEDSSPSVPPLLIFWVVAGGITAVVSLMRLSVQFKPHS